MAAEPGQGGRGTGGRCGTSPGPGTRSCPRAGEHDGTQPQRNGVTGPSTPSLLVQTGRWRTGWEGGSAALPSCCKGGGKLELRGKVRGVWEVLEEQLRELARYFLNFFPPNHLDVPTRVSLRVWSCKRTTRNNFLPVRGKLPCAQTLPRRTGSDLGWGTPKREGGEKKGKGSSATRGCGTSTARGWQ